MDVDGTERYIDIIDRYRNMPIEELMELQKDIKNSISYRHIQISSEVLKYRLQRSLNRIKDTDYKT